MQPKILLAAALVLVLAASPSFAGGGNHQGGNNQGGNNNNQGSNGQGAPGPIAGAGLGYLGLAGGYYLYRRWREQNPGK